ncbi:MAG: hypothetical protein R2699_12495 [Acidimicrobiales bacterium]|nr:hypothetical protein [Acidimicrobiales bacterium]
MSPDRRTVRTTQQFFEDLDRQLPAERGPNGEPSVHDFQVYELLRIVEQFAVEWDTLAELIPGRPDYRIVLAAGLLVPRIAVAGQLAPDGAIELIRLRLDLDAGWE